MWEECEAWEARTESSPTPLRARWPLVIHDMSCSCPLHQAGSCYYWCRGYWGDAWEQTRAWPWASDARCSVNSPFLPPCQCAQTPRTCLEASLPGTACRPGSRASGASGSSVHPLLSSSLSTRRPGGLVLDSQWRHLPGRLGESRLRMDSWKWTQLWCEWVPSWQERDANLLRTCWVELNSSQGKWYSPVEALGHDLIHSF